jgi:prolyl-tRNA editing enzyme YbaK/EbsC (Cys-tRNA(Pro) deacylase)
MRAMYAAQALALTSSYPQLKLAFQFQPSRNVVSSSSMVQVASEATSNVAEKDERRPSTASEAGGIGGPTTKKRRHSVLMDTSVKNFQRLLNNAGEHMRTEVENLPLRFYE